MTPFAKKVYQAVLSIPFGQTRSYQWVARKAGNARACRAVGTILKHNPYPLIIPCHRVIKSNNIAGDYAFGKKQKNALLGLEKALIQCITNKE